jgi:hypothetical protein
MVLLRAVLGVIWRVPSGIDRGIPGGIMLPRARAFARVLSALLSLAVLVGAMTFVVVVRSGITAVSEPPGVGASGAAALLEAAAKDIESLTSAGGKGIAFDAIQRTTEYRKAGGSPIPVVDPADQTKVVGTTDELYINGMMTQGLLTKDGFWMEMRLPPPPGQAADFDAAPRIFGVIQKNGLLWRDDGAGWYQTTQSPGMGIDPVSARQLPRALRKLASVSSLGKQVIDGTTLVGFKGTASIDDYPGVVAADGHDFTDGTFDFEVWFDPSSKLGRIVIRARNLNQTAYDLVSETVITFQRGRGGSVPEPVPTMAPESPPPFEVVAPTSGEVVAPTSSGSVAPTPSGSVAPTPSGSVAPTPSGSVAPTPSGSVAPASSEPQS